MHKDRSERISGQSAQCGNRVQMTFHRGRIVYWSEGYVRPPCNAVQTVGLNEQTIKRDGLCQIGDIPVVRSVRSDRESTAQIDIVLQPMRASVPVHQITVWIAADGVQNFAFHALGVQDDRLA